MDNYEQLVKALRRCDMKQGCFNANCRYSVGKYFCDMDKVHKDAAAAIEALQADVKKYHDAFGRLSKTAVELEQRVVELRELPKRGDMVEVVRCKDCAHFTLNGWCNREFDWFPVDETDFCSSAKKMEVQDG